MKSKKVIITLATVGLVGGSAMINPAQADAFWPFGGGDQQQSESGELPSFIQRLVDKFGLNKDEVVAELEADRQERQTEMQQQHQERISQAISEGLITQEQADQLEAMTAAEREENQANAGLAREERQAQMEEHRAEMESWAEEQGIDLEAVHDLIGFGGPREGRGGKGNGYGMGNAVTEE